MDKITELVEKAIPVDLYWNKKYYKLMQGEVFTFFQRVPAFNPTERSDPGQGDGPWDWKLEMWISELPMSDGNPTSWIRDTPDLSALMD